MTGKHVQWLTYHFNVEYMFHVALEQLHHIDNNDEIYFVNKFIFILNLSSSIFFVKDDSTLTDCSIYSNKIEDQSNENNFRYLFNLTIYLWTLLIIWIIFQMWISSFYF
jgi:hypothetical protein